MGAAMPAVLVELGFISNPEEETKLLDPAYRGDLAEALVRAIAQYKAAVEGQPAAASQPAPLPGTPPVPPASAPSPAPRTPGASPP
jgi:hypothetical protein